MKRMITGQGLEVESRGETGDQVAGREETEEKEQCEHVMTPGNILTEESRKGKETAERSSSEDRGTDIEMEREHGTEWLSGRMPDSRAREHRHESSYGLHIGAVDGDSLWRCYAMTTPNHCTCYFVINRDLLLFIIIII